MTKKKNLVVRARIDSDQRERIENFKTTLGIKSDSRFIREIIEHLDKNMMVISGDEDREIFEEINLALNKIGTNINQIAHFLNLEHLKGMGGNFRSIEDLFVIDKMKEAQIESLKSSLVGLDDVLVEMKKKIEKIYGLK